MTLLELHRFLIGDIGQIKLSLDANWELSAPQNLSHASLGITMDQILYCLDNECQAEAENTLGYYHLSGRSEIVHARRDNYLFGLKREKRIKRFANFLRYLPFVRGAAIGGSQSLGQQKEKSDIDLFIVAEPGFLWATRTAVSVFFQIFGLRRHGSKIKDRFCLNHYVAGGKRVDRERNLYKAMEYARLRPIVYPQGVGQFLENNKDWTQFFFPNFYNDIFFEKQSKIQKLFETLLKNPFGKLLERILGFFQKHKIHEDEFTFVLSDELSFHPQSQHRALLSRFFSH